MISFSHSDCHRINFFWQPRCLFARTATSLICIVLSLSAPDRFHVHSHSHRQLPLNHFNAFFVRCAGEKVAQSMQWALSFRLFRDYASQWSQLLNPYLSSHITFYRQQFCMLCCVHQCVCISARSRVCAFFV